MSDSKVIDFQSAKTAKQAFFDQDAINRLIDSSDDGSFLISLHALKIVTGACKHIVYSRNEDGNSLTDHANSDELLVAATEGYSFREMEDVVVITTNKAETFWLFLDDRIKENGRIRDRITSSLESECQLNLCIKESKVG